MSTSHGKHSQTHKGQADCTNQDLAPGNHPRLLSAKMLCEVKFFPDQNPRLDIPGRLAKARKARSGAFSSGNASLRLLEFSLRAESLGKPDPLGGVFQLIEKAPRDTREADLCSGQRPRENRAGLILATAIDGT
jgi:hypothetical protein